MLLSNMSKITGTLLASCCLTACAADSGEEPTQEDLSALSNNDGCLFVTLTRSGDTIQTSAVDHCGRAWVDLCFEDVHSAFQLAQAACVNAPNGPSGASWTFSASALIQSANAGGINHWPGPFVINTAAFFSILANGPVSSVVDIPFTPH